MNNKITPKLLEKAKTATSIAALLALAKENGINMSNQEAADYYAKLHPIAGKIADEELDSVSGGCSGQDIPQTCPQCGEPTYYDIYGEHGFAQCRKDCGWKINW